MRLIDADALSESIINGSGTAIQKFFADACVAGAKTVEDVAPVVHGKWKEKKNFYQGCWENSSYTCSVCNFVSNDAGNYRPSCGAKMELPDD